MLFILVLFGWLFLTFPNQIAAIDEFQLNRDVIYKVDLTGKAQVEEKIVLTNNISQIYPTEYQINLVGSEITAITAADQEGNIIKDINQEKDSTQIKLQFNVQNIGKGKTTPINLHYSINKFAENKGNIWEISLPQYQNIGDNDQLTILIQVPTQFGKLAFSSLGQSVLTPTANYYQLRLNQNQVKNKNHLFIFGNYQLFDFTLQYLLDNQKGEATLTQIALPPALDSQKIIFKTIEPPPANINIDPDGNWLAEYNLKPGENLIVTAAGQAKIMGARSTGSTDDKLLSASQFWPVDNQLINQIAANLNTPQDIYNYVIKTLSYNFDGLNQTTRRQGALQALAEPNQALCLEFTDLFITLARAKGIPAREIEGFAYTNNPKLKPIGLNATILHAWPQYYDNYQQTWIAIDPTWGKTTGGIDYFHDLDLNHFILVIHGRDSLYPPPPDRVEVAFASQEIFPDLKAPLITADRSHLIITNPNPNPLFQINLISPTLEWKNTINFIGPYGKTSINLPKMSFIDSLRRHNQTIDIFYENQKYSLKYLPHYQNLALTVTAAIVLLCLCGIMITRHEKIS